jgi:hypothetical protein
MRRLNPIAVLACAALLSSCSLFDENAVQDITGPGLTESRIKFYNFGVNSPGVNFYADDVKMTAISTTRCVAPVPADTAACRAAGIESTTGIAYAGQSAGGLYSAITPGAHTITGRIAAATDNGLAISTVAGTIESGKYYSFYQSGIYNATTKTIDAFLIEDALPTGAPDFTKAQVRFVNAVSNGTGDLNLFATNTTTTTESPVGGPVAYKGVSGWVALDEGTYNIRAAYTGAGTNLVTRNTISLLGGRVYTITVRGSTATASTLGLDLTANQQ